MRTKTVYLAGLISTAQPESLEWRGEAYLRLKKEARSHYREINVLDPLRGKSNLSSDTKDGGITMPQLTAQDVILRDHHDVLSSDIILVHLDVFGATRPSVGTYIEVGWAWEHKKPVVAIAADDNYLARQHPFLQAAVTHYFTKLEDATHHIVRHLL